MSDIQRSRRSERARPAEHPVQVQPQNDGRYTARADDQGDRIAVRNDYRNSNREHYDQSQGYPNQPQQSPIIVNVTNTSTAVANAASGDLALGDSRFDGGLLSLIGWLVFGFLITLLTLGICFPLAMVRIYKWKTDHTIINGHRLLFTGTAIGLFGNWIKWFLLSIITLGIYSFWVVIKLEQWKVEHTMFQH